MARQPNPIRRKPECKHPDRPHYGLGLCKSCYHIAHQKGGGIEFKKRLVNFDLRKQEVVDHIAKSTVLHAMDTEAAVRAINPNMTYAQVDDTVEHLESSPTFKKAVEVQLRAKGLDDASKEVYVEEMWKWLIGGENERLKIAAARILGRGFIGEKQEANKPIELKLTGFEGGLEKMLGGATAKGEIPADTFIDDAEEGDDDELGEFTN